MVDRRSMAVTRRDAEPRDVDTRRRYTAEDRRRALAVIGECGGNLTQAAARLGLTVPLLSRWRSEAIRARHATSAGGVAQRRRP